MTRTRSARTAAVAGLLPALAGVAFTATASETAKREKVACQLEDMTRYLSLRVDPEAGYVCDVLYEKPDEGDTREVLWSARNTVDYCRPRYTDMVEQLAARGWTCDYADEPNADDGAPAVAAAEPDRRDDDEATSEGTRGQFRDWCVADTATGTSADGKQLVRTYCDCVAGEMDAYGLSEDDAQIIFNGLSAVDKEDDESTADLSKRMNTLATQYESVVDSCQS